nr:MAG TPA: Protein of unknown function (DUF1652) [Caudoviricetes sp.]
MKGYLNRFSCYFPPLVCHFAIIRQHTLTIRTNQHSET